MIKIKLENGLVYGITTDMPGKMKEMLSLNTSPSLNPFCLKMRTLENVVCKSCYSFTGEAFHKNKRKAWIKNYHVLSENRLKESEIPYLNLQLFRFQAHGDLINRIHYLNLIAFAEKNATVLFALWTKNISVINRGGLIKLDNLVYVYSTPKLNELNPVLPKGFDKMFTVYNRPFLRKHSEVEINCQSECFHCRRCYEKNGIIRINERIKSSHKD